MKITVYKNLLFFIIIYIILNCLAVQPCQAYQAGAHTWIALEALKLADNPDLQNQSYANEIQNGSWEADFKFYDSVLGLWRDNNLTAFRDHFWNPDTGDALGLTSFTAYQKASEYWYLAVAVYKENPKLAYTYLGHIAHLLADMAVPAHVLIDPHPINDSYEEYIEKNYINWTAESVTTIKKAVSGYDLFYNLAQRAQYFPSNDRLGNQVNTDSAWFSGWPQNSSNMRIDENRKICVEGSEGCHIEDTNTYEIGSHLLPLAIEYTAALYNFFYEQVSLPTIDGIMITGNITLPGQKNLYPFTVTSSGKYAIYTRGTTSTYGVIYDASYNALPNVYSTTGELNNVRYEVTLAPGTYYFEVRGSNTLQTGSYRLHIDAPGAGTITDRDDHGASPWNATGVSVGSVTAGALDVNGDKDFFKFTVTSSGKYAIYTRGTTSTYGVIYGASYNALPNVYSTTGELNNVRYEVTLAPGTYYFEVRGSNTLQTGSYRLHIDAPGAGTITDRDDHGASPWNATGVSVGSVTAGALDVNGDKDFFKFTVTSSGKYAIYTRGTTSTYGVIYGASYNALPNVYSTTGELNNVRYEVTLAPGTYYFEVRGSNTLQTGSYRLHIDAPGAGTITDRDDHGASPWNATGVSVGSVTAGALDVNGDKDFFKFTVTSSGKYAIYTRGTTSTYGVIYDASYNALPNVYSTTGELNNVRYEVTLAPGTYYFEVRGSNTLQTGSYRLHIDAPGAGTITDRDDHGASPWNATGVSVGSVTAGALDVNGDKDFFKFTVTSSGKYAIYTRGTTSTYGVIYGASYNALPNVYSTTGELNNVRYEVTLAPGTYYFEVRGSNTLQTGSYQLHIDAPPDSIPDAFSFPPQTNVALSVVTISNSITVSSINLVVPISISGGSYSINGGAYTTAAGTVNSGNTVTVRLTSSSSYSNTTSAILTIGGVSGTFSVITKAQAVDTTPDQFSFTPQTNIAQNTLTTSNSITVSGTNAASPISIIGGSYSINDGAYTTAAGTVNNGNTVTVRLTSSASNATTTNAILTIGGVSGTFSITTQAAATDTIPDPFSFTAQANIALTTVSTSNSTTVTGINTATPISITGGSYSINGGAYTTAAGTVSNGSIVTVRLTSSATYVTTTRAALSIGGVSGTFGVTTLADTIPDPFLFNAQTNVALTTVTTSNTITVSGITHILGDLNNDGTVNGADSSLLSANYGQTNCGNVADVNGDCVVNIFDTSILASNYFINAASPISITGGSYSINGGTYTSTAGTVANGNTVTVRLTSSASNSTTTSAILTIGGVSGTFSVTTKTQAQTDATAPTITTFIMPSTAMSLTVSGISFSALDDVGVTGYLITESSTKPSSDSAGWSSSAPTSFTFSSSGTKTAYAWAKDAAGNISASLSKQVTITPVDSSAPTITVFSIPPTAISLTVPISSFTATDNIGVTSYLLSESAIQPMGNAQGWSAILPTKYIFTSQGAKTLYAFAKDAAGNISAPLNATVTINLADSTPPVVTDFMIPANATSLTVTVTSLIATDNVGVVRYLLRESGTQPQANDPEWSANKPTSFTFLSQGVKTLYAFAKDAAGNISVPLSASVNITLTDKTAPVVSSFTIPTTATNLTVSIISFSATDAVGVTGYYLSETSTAPLQNDSQWTTTPISSFIFASAGSKTLYAFVKDAAGNVSVPVSDTVMITLEDTTAPTVIAFTMPTSATNLTVPVTTFIASDNISVTGYIIKESATVPSASFSGWTSTAPSSYTFNAAGSLVLYAFVKDAAGNVSSPIAASISLTLSDSVSPTVTTFAIPATSSSLTVPVTIFTATDNVAVTGYLLSEVAATPTLIAQGWTSTKQVSYTFSTTGSKTLYAFAKDAAGNISPPASDSVVITTAASTQFTVTTTTGSGYTIAPSTPQTVTNNGTTTFNVTPTSGYGVVVSGCSGNLTGNTYTTGSITTDCTISVTAVARKANSDGSTQPPTISDALKVIQAIVGTTPLTSAEQIRYDVAPLGSSGTPVGNGAIDAADVILILRRSIGIGSW